MLASFTVKGQVCVAGIEPASRVIEEEVPGLDAFLARYERLSDRSRVVCAYLYDGGHERARITTGGPGAGIQNAQH